MLATSGSKEWELERVHAWRIEMLMALGITHADACTLALCTHIDWHDAKELVDNGCPPALVFELLT